ncbi:MAG: YibE/F family protein [Firmicutes bacterium]|nr:YibE/F family protein [Bacillota bacterium]
MEIIKEEPEGDPINPDNKNSFIKQKIVVQLLDPPYQYQTVIIENHAYPPNQLQGIYLREGDKVIVYGNRAADGKLNDVNVQDLARDNTVILLAVVFVAVLVIFGRLRGIAALLSLASMGLLIWYWLLPSILNGGSPLKGGAVVCILVSLFSIPLICGFNRKSLCAIIGTIAGVTIAGLLAYFSGVHTRIVGVEFEYSNFLTSLPKPFNLNLQGIYFAGVLIGCLGAVMDTGISVASAIQEFVALDPQLSRGKLWKTGMNVGRDVMSMMSSTLILAYVGGAIPLLLLMMGYETPFLKIFNSDMIVSEIIRSLAGSIGLSLSIPITALTGALLLGAPKPQKSRRARSG